MPNDIAPYGQTRCNIYQDGPITFSQTVLDEVQWRVRQQITVSNLKDLPLTLLFRLSDPDATGFILSYLNRTTVGGSGGKLSCQHIVRSILSLSLALPLRDIPPIYLDVDRKSGVKPYQIALLLAEPTWTDVEFTATSAEHFPQRLMGVYQVINSDPEKPLRIGQGNLQQRLRENLKIGDLRAARRFLYFPMTRKADMLLLEHIFLQRYKQENGQLPPGNKITA